jgi:phosphatidylserine/phosphatidylglycerophosphate/cardiolipin synthase-like enzyme
MTARIGHAVSDAAMRVPQELLLAGAAAIASAPRRSSGSRLSLINASPAARYREHVERIARAWSLAPDCSGAVVAAALRTAASTAAAVRAEHKVSLVRTRPSTEAVLLRSARSVLSTLVANANESLVLVSFASHDGAELAAELRDAAERGVDVTLILKTPDDPGGPLVIDPAHPFAPISDTASFYRWPSKLARRRSPPPPARLHAKCVIADRSSVMITSANLTSAGINDNIELGVLIEAGDLPVRLSRHPGLLIENGVLEKVSP